MAYNKTVLEEQIAERVWIRRIIGVMNLLALVLLLTGAASIGGWPLVGIATAVWIMYIGLCNIISHWSR
jgi:hypothetical protein